MGATFGRIEKPCCAPALPVARGIDGLLRAGQGERMEAFSEEESHNGGDADIVSDMSPESNWTNGEAQVQLSACLCV